MCLCTVGQPNTSGFQNGTNFSYAKLTADNDVTTSYKTKHEIKAMITNWKWHREFKNANIKLLLNCGNKQKLFL